MPISRKPDATYYAIKAEVTDLTAASFTFAAGKTMYGGKHIATGDIIFLFASETKGGAGLFAHGIVTSALPVAKKPALLRQTPRVTISVKRTALAIRPLGRAELKHAAGKTDNPAGELHFKFYRQATNKIIGLSEPAAQFLNSYF